MTGIAFVALLSSCDTPAGPRVDFLVTHTDQMKHLGSSPLDLPPEPALVQGGTGAVEARGLIAAPDACDDLVAQLETNSEGLTLRVIVRGSRLHPGGCGGPGEFALVQWQARIEPVEGGRIACACFMITAVVDPTPPAIPQGAMTIRNGLSRSRPFA